MKLFLSLSLCILIFSCKKSELGRVIFQPQDKTYLALGDSYTVGDAIYREESFPYQLTERLKADGVRMTDPEVFAYTGWTTTDLIRAMKIAEVEGRFDIVTLLIGANNQYMRSSPEEYRKEFAELLERAVELSGRGRASVFVISLPDWTVTPFGKLKDRKEAPAELALFNAINREEAENASVHYIDITPHSRLAEFDQSLTSIDSLHPSGKMYREWVNKLYPLVRKEIY
jgi:lysophospholipase L1-like esterase